MIHTLIFNLLVASLTSCTYNIMSKPESNAVKREKMRGIDPHDIFFKSCLRGDYFKSYF